MDLVCSEYNWTVEQVFSHTKDQIELLMKAMNKRKMAEIKVQADLHGAKMKNSSSDSVNVENTSKLKSMGINIIEE